VEAGYLRIGELGRRVGVNPELLRAWESRYGLLSPSRSQGGFRLYSDEDERRVREMQALLARGVSAAEAARLVLSGGDGAQEGSEPLAYGLQELRLALDAFDEPRANQTLDGLFAAYGVETVLGRVVLPYLNDLGERWARGDASVGQEHFASNLLRGRLLGFARGWGQGRGPLALLACAPGELHDLGLIVFGLALSRRGWRVTFLGPDTPLDTLEEAVRDLEPALVVVTASTEDAFAASAGPLRRLAKASRLAVGGHGATAGVADSLRGELLASDPIAEAERIAAA
jgi:DNA-binding transcriptional MerR regulator